MAITTQPHYFHNGFPALSSPPPRPPSSTPLSYHLLKCINSSEINSLLYDAVSANVMIFVQKMGESESGFSFAFGSQPFKLRFPILHKTFFLFGTEITFIPISSQNPNDQEV